MQTKSAFSVLDRELLAGEGWAIISEKPAQIKDRLGSYATGFAVLTILADLHRRNKKSTRDAIRFAIKAINTLRCDSNSKKLDKIIKDLTALRL